MTNNELQTQQAPTLAVYNNNRVNLMEVRRSPKKFQRIRATENAEAVKRLKVLVYAAFLYRGQATNAETVAYIASALVQEIMADTVFGLPDLSWVEVGYIIRRAVLGAGKELFGVSVASLYGALVDYAKNEGHELARQITNL